MKYKIDTEDYTGADIDKDHMLIKTKIKYTCKRPYRVKHRR